MKYQSEFARWNDIFKRLAGRGIYPHELAYLLDTPIRKLILSPNKLADRLHLSAGSIVLEIGSGPGYFSSEVAKRISNGHLILFDIQTEMLKKSLQKLEHEKIRNANAVRGNAITLPFNRCVFDVVFLVTVLGEVTDPKECINSINEVLRIGGILSITEMQGDPDVLAENELNKIVRSSGFEHLEKFPSFKGFTINYKKVTDI